MVFLTEFFCVLSFQLMFPITSLLQPAKRRAQPTSHTGGSWEKGQKPSMPSIFPVLHFLQHAGSLNHFVFSFVICFWAAVPVDSPATWVSKPDTLTTALQAVIIKFAHDSSEREPACYNEVRWLKAEERFCVAPKLKAATLRDNWYLSFLVLA